MLEAGKNQGGDNMEIQTTNEGQVCALNVSADEIINVSQQNGEFIITLKDGTKTNVAAPSGAASPITFELTSGEVYTSQDMVSLFAMAAPEEIYNNSIEEAQFTAFEEQAREEELQNENNQPAELSETAESGQEEAMMEQIAEELAEVETAAGDEGGTDSGGSGFNSSFKSQSVDQLEDIGALERTQLQYGVENKADDDCGCDDLFALEPKLTVDAQQQVYEDGSVQIMLTAVPDSANGVMTITIVGIPSSWGVSGDGTYNPGTLTWTYVTTPGQTYTGGPILTPPADDDTDLTNLVLTVSERDSNTGQTGSTSTLIDVIVDAVADTPEINAQDTAGLEDTAVEVKITGGPGDKDGSEIVQKYVITGVPEGFSLSAGTEITPGTWQLAFQQTVGLKLTGPANFYGDVPLQVTIYTAETVTDSDFDLTNNTANASDTLVVSFIPVADPPVVHVDLPHGSECGCPDNDGLVAQVYEDNHISVDFSATRDAGASPTEFLSVTVSGVDLTKLEAGSFTISGQDNALWTRVAGSPDTAASFTITLPAGTDYDGSMTFTPKANSDVDVSNITVTATAHEPASGTTAASNIETFDVIVDAVADKPTIHADDVLANDKGITVAITISANVTDNDGSESITHYQIKNVPNDFSFNQGTDLGNGVWQFTPAQIQGLTITPPAGYEGEINLPVHVFNYDNPTDKDFNTTNNENSNCDTLTIEWKNDRPVAIDDDLGALQSYAGQPPMVVNVLANDTFSLDGGNHISGAHFINGTSFTVAQYNDYVNANNYGGPTKTTPTLTLDQFMSFVNTFQAQGGTLVDIVAVESGAYALFNYGDRLEILSIATKWHVTSELKIEYTLQDIDGDFSKAIAKTQAYHSPLVFDLDGDGIELVNADAGVMFDMNNDGVMDQTGWVAPDDGLLALDVNGDGIVNNQSELFGNTDAHANGFQNLAQHDLNGDGVINSSDAVFSQLVIWQDANQDGFSDVSEMFSLMELQIASINLNATAASYKIGDNVVTDESTFTRTDGTTGSIVDAWFAAAAPAITAPEETQTGTDGVEDVFAFDNDDNTFDTIKSFNADDGDVLDITALLDDSFDPLQDAINDFVFSTVTEEGTVLSVDATGSGNAETAVQFAVLQGVTASVEDLRDTFLTA